MPHEPLPSIVWFQKDLRVADHAALSAAAARGPVVPLYVLDPDEYRGAASCVALQAALKDLQTALLRLGAPLVLRKGDAARAVLAFARETKSRCVYATRSALLDRVSPALRAEGIEVYGVAGSYAMAPGALLTKNGTPYKVFTPFYRAHLALPELPPPLRAPRRLEAVKGVASAALETLGLSPQKNGARSFDLVRDPLARLDAFIAEALADYPKARNEPACDGTSRLSIALHWGQITPTQIFHALKDKSTRDPACHEGATAFWRQIVWRDFAASLLHHFPETAQAPFQKHFTAFPWRVDEGAFERWQKGQTGFPLIDAGMRQLWQTGWMHGRVRMLVASFLTKDLLIPWQKGAAWFMETLADADAANNVMGWQWAAGCGADAAPYVRIFNPARQAARFDPKGTYIRRWVPELAGLPDRALYDPSQATDDALKGAGVALGKNYPLPMVDHAKAFARARAAFQSVQRVTESPKES